MECQYSAAFVSFMPSTSVQSIVAVGHGTNAAFRIGRPHAVLPKRRYAANLVTSTSPIMMTGPDGGREGGKGDSGSVPINAPSAVLLLVSSVLAIASIGCVFELSGGKPTYGPTATSGILAASLPGFIFTFYAAVRKGQQEAMDDP